MATAVWLYMSNCLCLQKRERKIERKTEDEEVPQFDASFRASSSSSGDPLLSPSSLASPSSLSSPSPGAFLSPRAHLSPSPSGATAFTAAAAGGGGDDGGENERKKKLREDKRIMKIKQAAQHDYSAQVTEYHMATYKMKKEDKDKVPFPVRMTEEQIFKFAERLEEEERLKTGKALTLQKKVRFWKEQAKDEKIKLRECELALLRQQYNQMNLIQILMLDDS